MPKELCVCEAIEKEAAKIKIYLEKKRYRKNMTIIEGISKDMNPEEILRKLKKKLACGGTYKNGRLELQGDHREKLKKLLQEFGFTEEQIEVII